jgi:hypothetical protein
MTPKKVQRESSRFRKLMAAQLNAGGDEQRGPNIAVPDRQHRDASEAMRSEIIAPARTV